MFFSENACCYCQPLSSTLPVTLFFVHPLKEMLKCCFCGSEGASMTDFHDLQLKEQLLLQQKWEDDVWPPVTTNGNNATLGRKQKAQVAEKVLSIIRKYKRTQLPFLTSYVFLIPGSATACLQTLMHTLTFFVGLLPLFFQTCFCMEKKRTALNADQSQVTKSAKKLRWVAEPSDKKCKKTSVVRQRGSNLHLQICRSLHIHWTSGRF